MKKILLPIGSILLSGLTYGQTSPSDTQNYIQTRSYLEPVTSTSTSAKQFNTVKYYDGLGRPKQTVSVKASPKERDVVNHIVYDGFGRQALDYLPVPQPGTQNGAIYATPLSNATQNDLYGAEKIYAEKQFESSPLSRVSQQKNVGTAWNDKPIILNYDANIDGEVKKYSASFNYTTFISEINFSGSFGTGQLYKNIVTDEDNNKTIEFKNAKGQVLLVKKMISVSQSADTYYVYNQFDQLAYVISPEAVDKIKNLTAGTLVPTIVLDNLCYQYTYDNRNRLVEKKLPGKGKEYFVYDNANRLILSQDTNQKKDNKWLITKYDKFGRVAYTGFLTGGERVDRQNEIANLIITESRSSTGFTRNGITVYYTDNAFVNEIPTILSINYYDTYPGYDFNPAFPTAVLGEVPLTDVPNAEGLSTKSLPLMKLVKNVEDDNWTKNYTYYDKKGRSIRSYSINHLGGRTQVDSKFDFSGAVKQTVTTHKRLDTNTDTIITENFTYDHQNRLLTHTHQVNSNAVEYLAQNKYNELSQIESKKVGGTAAGSSLQQIDYKYNIRGWMTKINDPVDLNGKFFGYEIKYNNPVSSNIAPGRFNGNIAEIDWKNSFEGVLKRYNYEYDNLNRLKNAFYKEPTTGNSNFFDEYLTYDLNGNITNLKRSAIPISGQTSTLVDNLDYIYDGGNRLTQVIENQLNSTGYEGGNNMIDYDLNGNMINMKDKGISLIEYNHLNLPDAYSITQNDLLGGIVSFGLSYLYRADGIKVRKTNSRGGGRGQSTTYNYTDYLDGFQYNALENVAPCLWCRTEVAYEEQAFKGPIFDPNFPTGWRLDFVPTAEGFYSFAENRYIYQYRDHLENARVTYAKNNDGILEIRDTNNYYAFGANHIGGFKGNLGSFYSYKYNGKELQESGMYDYGARFYMPDLGRWGVVDPLAEKANDWSPYRYAFNNPTKYIDTNGLYETDGHFWTVYLMATIMGRKDAYTLAYFTEAPDNIMSRSGEVMSSPSTWMDPVLQRSMHALNGGRTVDARNIGRSMVTNAGTNEELGTALHYFGDSYAHSRLSDGNHMYANGIGHLGDWHEPDKIAKRPDLYLEYVNNLSDALQTKLGGGKVDMFTFEYVAGHGGSTEENSAVFETEVRIREGVNTFTVAGNQVDTINNYMYNRNVHYRQFDNKTNVKYTNVDVYQQNKAGEWIKTTEKRTVVKF